MDTNKITRATLNKINEALYQLGLTYWDYLPIYQIDSILVDNGLEATEAAIYCGRNGATHEEVGHGKYLTLNWHKMDSGRYEVVAYLN